MLRVKSERTPTKIIDDADLASSFFINSQIAFILSLELLQKFQFNLRACLKSHFGQSYLHGNRVFSSKLGFFRNPERPTLFKHILSLYSANRVRSMIGTWFSSPTVWENQRLPPNVARSGLPNPQHLGTISCFLKQVLNVTTIARESQEKNSMCSCLFLYLRRESMLRLSS